MNNVRTIDQVALKGKRVLIRVDFNVPMNGKEITSNKRIVKSLPTIKKALDSGAKVILLSHLGRVKQESDKSKRTLKYVSEELSRLLNKNVKFIPHTSGQMVKDAVKALVDGDVLLLENTRFEDLNNKAESGNNPRLGKFWASLGDVFIFDAFGTAHRAHASTVGIAQNIGEAAIGYLVQEELEKISRALVNPARPSVAIIGGAKIKDKIKTIDNLLNKYDRVIIGGGMAYVFCKAQGIDVGDSIVKDDSAKESELIAIAKDYLKKYQERIVLPIDSALSPSFDNIEPIYNKYNSLEIPSTYRGLDIGPKTINLFKWVLLGAKTVIWNGPIGVCEFSNYANGTREIAKAISTLPNAFTLIGGGDSAAAIASLGLEKSFSHISTGGGACLALLEGSKLPVIETILKVENSAKMKTAESEKTNQEIESMKAKAMEDVAKNKALEEEKAKQMMMQSSTSSKKPEDDKSKQMMQPSENKQSNEDKSKQTMQSSDSMKQEKNENILKNAEKDGKIKEDMGKKENMSKTNTKTKETKLVNTKTKETKVNSKTKEITSKSKNPTKK